VEDTQPSELKNQGVTEIRPNLEAINIETEKDTTPHLEVERLIEEQHSSPHAESQAEHVMDTDEFIDDSSAGYERTPKTGDS
ncbi:hypothetical protein A2U01_0090570, partial [Trifolium medium]|nr:hypothetical protein [Trifolium medium]